MELNETALRFLADQAVNAHGPQEPVFVFDGRDNDKTYKPTLILAPGQKLEDVEHLFPARSRFRGELTTTSVADFIAYTKNRVGPAPAAPKPVFIDATHMQAKAFFNLGTESLPGHADDRAWLQAQATAAFNELRNVTGNGGVNNKTLDQRGFAEFIEDWRDIVRPFNGVDDDGAYTSTTVQKAVMAVRKVSIEAMNRSDTAVGDLSAEQSTLARIEAKSTEALPIAFGFKCTPYEGLDERDFIVRVSILTGSKEPQFRLRIVRMEEHIEAMAQNLKHKLAEGLGEAAAIYVGVFKP